MDYDTVMYLIVIFMTVSSGVLLVYADDNSNEADYYKILYKQAEEILEKETQRYAQMFNETVSDYDQKIIIQQIESRKQQTEIDRLTDRLNYADNKLLQVSEMYNNQIDTDKVIVRPTYQEVLEFLAGDHTNSQAYTDNYDCTEFSNEMIANARDKGIFACTTELNYLDERGHMLVAFNTIDRGIIYIEPQTDDIMTKDFSPGEIYWTNKILKISSCWEVKT